MKTTTIPAICLGILFGIQTVSAQTEGKVGFDPRNPVPEWYRKVEEKRERERRVNGIGRNGMMVNRDVMAPRTPLYKGLEKETEELRNAFLRTRHMLIVPQSYYEKYKFLLKDKNVELARLQPEKNCYANLVVSVKDLEKCSDVVPIPGGGSFYSFRTKLNYPLEQTAVRTANRGSIINTIPVFNSNSGENWWNIHFIEGNFKVENNSVQGIISEIGDVDLENLNLSSTEFEFLKNFEPKNTLMEIKQQNEILKKGVKSNNLIYSNVTSIKLNSTYILRSIDHRPKLVSTAKNGKEADMTIALKVVGQETDGSVIILWKRLKSQRLETK